MDNQGENGMSNDTSGQTTSGGMPPNSPDYNSSMQPNNVVPTQNNVQPNAIAPTPNVTQHVLGDSRDNQPANSVSPTPEVSNRNAIYSTPTESPNETDSVPIVGPTTISSADVAIPETDPNEAARIHAALDHPYFSNHPTQTASSGIGDVVINNRRPKTRRKISKAVVFGLIGLAAIVVAGGIVLAVSRGDQRPSKADIKQSFEQYASYVESGPEGMDRQDQEDWFLLGLTEGLYSREDQLDFTNKARSLFQTFSDMLFESKKANSKLLDATQDNGELLDVILDYINLQALVANNELDYLNSGEDAAIKQIDGRRNDFRNPLAKNLKEKITQYLRNNVSILNIYKQHSCIIDSSISDECVINIVDDAELESLRTQNNALDQQLLFSYSNLSEEFRKSTDLIKGKLDE